MAHETDGWEPDPNKVGNWRALFEQPGRNGGGQVPMREEAPEYDAGPELDPASYKPWVLQRGQSRPTMMLGLRRYEPRSGLWIGWLLAWPQLIAVEYIGERMLSLDFGTRQFVLEGRGLDELARHLQQGSVVTVLEHTREIWPALPDGPVVSAIRKIGAVNEPMV